MVKDDVGDVLSMIGDFNVSISFCANILETPGPHSNFEGVATSIFMPSEEAMLGRKLSSIFLDFFNSCGDRIASPDSNFLKKSPFPANLINCRCWPSSLITNTRDIFKC